MTAVNQIKKTAITLVAALAITSGSASFATSIPQQLEEAKMKYERLYKQYTEALSDSASGAKHSLAGEVEAAKRRYEELKKQFSMSQQTKDNIKQTADKVAETVKKVFDSGSGDKAEAPSSTSAKILPGFEDQKISIDGDNYCGQYAMTSVFQGMGIPMDPQKAYKDTNPAGIFTAPPTIVEYLNMNGVDASQKHRASISDIVKKIDDGKPVICLVNSGGSTPHWINIYGYTTDATGNVTGLKMRDSYWGTSKGYEMSVEKFSAAWKNPLGTKLPGSIAGYENLMIDIKGAKAADFSPRLFNFNFNSATEDNIAGGINDVVTGFKRLAPMQLAGGVVKCTLGIPGAVAGLAGRGISMAGDSIMNWGREKVKTGSTLTGGVAIVAGGITKAAGWVANTAGNFLSGAASVLGNATKKLGYVFAR